ncbi:MAG TPA: M14 metallopeptidase family protein [Vicinamibacterales bacterium]|nr:M14 metallopeptidase family protein [Vicinamibacterales bacterium]
MKTRVTTLVLAPLIVLLTMAPASAQVKAPADYLGFRVGEDYKLADWSQITGYFEALGKTSDRVRVEEIGLTTLRKPFLRVTISSPANLAKLARYEEITHRLADPRGLAPDAADQLIAEGKAVLAITCSVHATEVAAAQMSMELAFNLATGNTGEIRNILDNVILILVPSLNPDGLDIVVNWQRKTVNTPFDGAPVPELYHHYAGHDNNRDWYMFTQAETRNTIDGIYKKWHPQVLYDVHQMGNTGARLFVPPFLDPYEPNIDPILIQGASFIGQAMMNRLIGEGKTGITTNAVYDAWTPARAYQHYHGAVRILTEAASVRYASPIRQSFSDLRPGLGYDPRVMSWKFPSVWRGGEWHLRDIVDYELTSAMGALENMAYYRERWLRNFYTVQKRAVSWSGSPYAFVVPPDQRDPVTAAEMLNIMQFGEVEVHQAQAPFTADGVRYPTGSYVMKMAQPFGAFAKTMMEQQVYPDLREYPGGPPQRPYDVTAHTLPMQMGVKVVTVERPFEADLAKVETITPPVGRVVGGGPAAAYLLEHESNASMKALNRLMKEGAEVYWAARPIVAKGSSYPTGTMIVRATAGLEGKLQAIARDVSVNFVTLNDRLRVDAYRIKPPRIAMYKSYVASMDEGWSRFIFEQYDLSVASLGDADIRAGNLLAKYDVVLIPGELNERQIVQGHRPGTIAPEYAGGIGEAGVQNLREFVDGGGTLVALDAAVEFAARQFALPVTNVLADIRPQDFYVPGSLLKVVLDTDNPIAYGMPREAAVFFAENAAFEIKGNTAAVGTYPFTNPLMSGWILGSEKLQGKTAVADVPVGRGRVILLSIRPQFRAQVRGTYKLLFNSLFYGAATLTVYDGTRATN